MGADIVSLDPQIPFDDVSTAVLWNIFDTLVDFDHSLRLSPRLALRWINPDERTWRFFLDPEARFSDGSPLRASDVKFSIERLMSLSGSELQSFTRHISGVKVVDELTVDLQTERPVAILNNLAFIPIVSQRHESPAGERESQPALGTGPFKLVRHVEGKSIQLTVNEHHTPPPTVRDVVFEVHEGEALLEQILRTKPDMAITLGQAALEGLIGREIPGLRFVSSPSLYVFYAILNVRPEIPGRPGSNPLHDPRVRRALVLGTSQEEIIREASHGLGRTVSQLVVPEVFGFDPDIVPPDYNPRAAQELLAAAGYSGMPIRILADVQASQHIAELLSEQWGRAGIRASVEVRSYDQIEQALEAGTFSLAIQGWGCTSTDASELLSFLLHSRDPATGYGVFNYSGFEHPELNRISEEHLGVFWPPRRLEMLQRALRIAAEEGPYLPLFSQHESYVVSDAIRWTPRLDGEFRLSDVEFQ
jgi:peptide/nickel transport system substrate-binding protein